jgi:hypothetical protein
MAQDSRCLFKELVMGCPLFPEAYEELVEEDIKWLEDNTERSLERGHIISILRENVKYYKKTGYMQAMCPEMDESELENRIKKHGIEM